MTRKKVLETIHNKITKVNLESLQKEIAKKFYGVDNVVAILYYAILTNTNVILYGPGGFGKTEIVKEFLKQTKLQNSTLVGYEDMDVEALLGLPNMTKMLEESVYETSFDRSVFKNPGVLVLEEFLDVNPRTATALKDILTSGGLRQGTTIMESLVSSVIICSNKAPEELNFDDSSAAFYLERFPLTLKVFPETLDSKYYLNIISTLIKEPISTFKAEYSILAEIAYRTSVKRNIVSPRTIKYAINLLQATEFKLSNLEFMSELDTSDITAIRLLINSKTERAFINRIKVNVTNKLNELAFNTSSQRMIMDALKDIATIENKLNLITITEDNSLVILKELQNKCASTKQILWKALHKGETKNIEIEQLFKWE